MAKQAGASFDPRIREDVEALAMSHPSWAVKHIYEGLRQRHQDKADFPSKRTVEIWVSKLRSTDASGGWSLVSDTTGDPQTVLGVLAVVVARTHGEESITQAQAQWIVKVCSAAPDLPPWLAWVLGRAYSVRASNEELTDDLDAYLAFGPWHGEEAHRAYSNAVQAGWVRLAPVYVIRAASGQHTRQEVEQITQQRRERRELDRERHARIRRELEEEGINGDAT